MEKCLNYRSRVLLPQCCNVRRRIVKQGSKKLMDDENEVADAVTLAGDGTEKEKIVNRIDKQIAIVYLRIS